jgi:acyl carrier protein
MSETAIYDRLNDVFHSVFFDDSIKVNAKTAAPDLAGWDSVAHMNLMVAIEGEFNVEFTTDELETMDCVGDMVRLIQAKAA